MTSVERPLRWRDTAAAQPPSSLCFHMHDLSTITLHCRTIVASYPYFNGTGPVYVCSLSVSRRNNEVRACTGHHAPDHVPSLCRSVYCQLRQLRPVVRSITADAAKMVVQDCLSSRLDYCNSLLCGIAGNLLQKLQSVQNAV